MFARNPDGAGRKDQINIRASAEAISIMNALQEYWGISQAGIVEMLLREKARELGIKPNPLAHQRNGAPKKGSHSASTRSDADEIEDY
jgi:hypothetical protein